MEENLIQTSSSTATKITTPPVAPPSKPSAPPPMDPPKPENKPKNITTIILSVLLIIALGIAGYFGCNYYQTHQQPVIDEQPPIELLPTQDQEPTDNWKTFNNEAFGYQFKHPNNLTFEPPKGTDSSLEAKKKLWYVYKDHQSAQEDKYGITIAVWDNSDNLDLLDWLNKNTTEDKGDFWSNYYGAPEVNITVGGAGAFAFWDDTESQGTKPKSPCGQSCPVYMVYFSKNNFIYRVTLGFLTEYEQEIFDLFNQILSTFEFTEKEPYKTIDGKDYTYSFLYPSTFEAKLNPYGNKPKQEQVELTNVSDSSQVSLIEFRTVEAWYPEYPEDQVTIGNHVFWYLLFPDYPGGGQVMVMTEKGKEMIYEFRFTGTKQFEDPLIQQIISSFDYN